MNRKGFTLIELLAIIVVIAVVAVLIAPNIIESFDTSKNKSYDILIENIKLAGENYYQECEYGDLSDTSKYGALACSIEIRDNSTIVTLGKLASLGILKTNNKDNNGNYIVINPKTSNDINNCEIKIIKNVNDRTYKTTYTVSLNRNNGNTSCPTTSELS